MKPLWIELVSDGVANRFELEDCELVEMNWRLTEHPLLYRRVYEHEISHQDGNFKSKDFIHDMKSRTPGLFNFMLHNKSTWIQLLPIYYSKRRKAWVYDYSAISSWLMIGSIGLCVYWFLGGLL